MYESRCGVCCNSCERKEKVNCKGCLHMKKPFWGGECGVKSCCEHKGLNFCGECEEFPCEMLANMGKEQGFDPTIKIIQCRKWIQEVVQKQEDKRCWSIFPEAITNLPQADIPMKGVHAFLAQGVKCQVIFMEFDKDVSLPEHAHACQYGIVLEGKIELTIGIDEERKVYQKGERYYIPDGVKHFGKIYAGYADITFFDQQDRYRILNNK